MNIPSYPKVYQLGHAAILDLFKDPVIIEEKIDGSQFSFGMIDGQLQCRSHHCKVNVDYPGMFEKAVETAKELEPLLNPEWVYRCEFVNYRKNGEAGHNTLTYNRIPTKHIILFDINAGLEFYLTQVEKAKEAQRLGLECVPYYGGGYVKDFPSLEKFLNKESILGGTTIEGIVIKNYHRFGKDKHALMGKYVSEKFKEKNKQAFKTANKGTILQIGESLCTEARWNKAVQRLREGNVAGFKYTQSPKDIGPLLKIINFDVLEECKEEIKEKLFKSAWKNISKIITRGFPEWYKKKLAEKQFEVNKDYK